MLLMILPIFITSCYEEEGSSPVKKNKREDIVLTRSQEEMVNENMKFAFSLFSKINESEKEEPNWIISPLSASIALSMTANGAAEDSQTQIKDALGFRKFQMDNVNSYYKYLCNQLNDLSEVMKSLGVTDIFDKDKADFSNMTPDNISVNLVKQAARIKVDEKGCEAAVTTIVEALYGSAPAPMVEFNMNRPFVFLIKEESTGVILFMGKVTEL